MEENVALDSSKQKKFVKSIRSIKKLIKKKDQIPVPEKKNVPVKEKVKDGKVKKRRVIRGLVYLSHIPHGFYEHQMTEYFKQFGAVTNVRVIRSRRTGKSKGFAFVEFKETAVAEIVAETMNNYLMGKRLIKAAYIPPEKQRRNAKRMNWNPVNNPSAIDRMKFKKAFNENKDEKGNLTKARKLLSNLNKNKKKLSEMGINYDFFMPVDIPEALIKVKEEKEDAVTEPKMETKENKDKLEKKKGIKKQKLSTDDKTVTEDEKPKVKSKKEMAKEKSSDTKDMKTKEDNVKENKVDKKEQKVKREKLEEAGVKHMQNFIKIQRESDNDSDSPYEFDSDDYEKFMENDDEDNSDLSGDDDSSNILSGDDGESDDGDSSDDEQNEDSPEESVVDIIPKKRKGKPASKITAPVQPKQNKRQLVVQPAKTNQEQPKRKAPQRAPVPPKKPKFEKQNKQKPMKKQFKKKK